MCDTQGFGTVKLSDIKVGDQLIADGGFTCVPAGALLTVAENENGLYFPCDEGGHQLDGQEDEDGFLVGLKRPA